MPKPPVELHVVSDATGETAARLVTALEAQFPDQDFVEIRHPRVESEDDLHLAVNRMKGGPQSSSTRWDNPSYAPRSACPAGAPSFTTAIFSGHPFTPSRAAPAR